MQIDRQSISQNDIERTSFVAWSSETIAPTKQQADKCQTRQQDHNIRNHGWDAQLSTHCSRTTSTEFRPTLVAAAKGEQA